VCRIEQLRRKPGQTTIEVSNVHRSDTMAGLSGDKDAIERQLSIQPECCAEMQGTITRMQEHLPALKTVAGWLSTPGTDNE
jgi:hypothetical protein